MTTAATVTVTKATPIPVSKAPKQVKAMLVTDNGAKFVIPFAPRSTDLGGLAPRWDRVGRPQRRDLVRHAGPDLRTMSFTMLIENRNGESVEGTLNYLTFRVAGAPTRITVTGMSTRERGPWRLDRLTIKPKKRRPGDNAITSAEVDVELVEASDATVAQLPVNKGPASGGVKKAPPPPKVPPKPTPRYHTVKRGESVWKIARHYYGDPHLWPVIAKANAKTLRNPNRLRIGQRLVIPPNPKR